MKLASGSVVADRYRLTRLLGEGGVGEVWEATNVVTGRAVAIKRLRRALDTEAGSVSRARFVLEAQAACAVEHPNVVEILDFVDSEDEPPIIVMELLRGETLATHLERQQALAIEETARLLLPVVSAVGTAHARGIVHRDLKPANFFLLKRGEATVVKVLDFGIAKWMAARPEASFRTETGSTLGTPCYMAPEQALGEPVIDHRADIWALGVILYECLSGMRPVEGENSARIMVRLLSTGIMPIERLVPAVPRELASLVMRMLSREPSQRPGSLAEVGRVLRSLTPETAPDFGEPHVSDAPSGLDISTGPRTTAPGLATPLQRSTPKRPRLALGATLAVSALAVAGLLARAGTRDRDAPQGATPSAPRVASAQPRAAAPTVQSSHEGSSVSAVASIPSVAPTAPAQRPVRPASPPGPRGATRLASKPSTATDAPSLGSPSGATCERSRDCASRLCLALVCR